MGHHPHCPGTGAAIVLLELRSNIHTSIIAYVWLLLSQGSFATSLARCV